MRSAESLLADPTLEWWPMEMTDEIMPAGRSSPSAWVVPMADGGGFLLHDGEEGILNRALADGEVVAFCTFVSYGPAVVTNTREDGVQATPPMPAGATHVWVPDDSSSITGSVAELAETEVELAYNDVVEVEYFDTPQISLMFSAATKQFVVSPPAPTPPNLPLMDGDTNETH